MKKAKSYGCAIFWVPTVWGSREPVSSFQTTRPLVLLVEQYGRTWSIPKGHVEKVDANGLETAVRETEEEVGLEKATDYSIIYDEQEKAVSTSFKRESKGGPKEMIAITMYFAVSTNTSERMTSGTKITDPNITDSRWVSLKQAKKLLHKPDYKALVKLYEKGSWILIQNLMREGVASIYL